MPDVWQDQNSQDETLQETGSDYFDALSGEESGLENESSDWSDDESLIDLQSCSIAGSDPKVMPILIHSHVKEEEERQETKEGHVHVHIQTPTRNFSGCRRKIPRTPIPGHTDPLTEKLQLNLQSAFEELEIERRERLGQKCPLQLGNSSLLKKRETRSMAI
ncbi:hypothetical protein ZYGR_0S01010 [Zygosaccharomyces rouxii]|uniref:Uncharacterized protein n=1 Tax=Zygosaccharomyces rouxii TaxID=4956 RepID=A0A1Q3A2Q5_ZYGRO|nr:hypothetical protein ZYGR_0S01010 [Zygosaccharomyces rouxii]